MLHRRSWKMVKMIDKSVCDQFVEEARLAVKDESRTIHSPEVSSTIKGIYDFCVSLSGRFSCAPRV